MSRAGERWRYSDRPGLALWPRSLSFRRAETFD